MSLAARVAAIENKLNRLLPIQCSGLLGNRDSHLTKEFKYTSNSV